MRIGGKSGPVSVFIKKPNRKSEEAKRRFRKLVELVKKTAVPREADVNAEELAAHLRDFYGAEELPVSRSQEWCLKRNVIPNFFPEILPCPVRPPEGAGKKEILAWAEREQQENGEFIDQLDPGKLGLIFHVHRIPEEKMQSYLEAEELADQDLLVEWEERTGYLMVGGPGCRKLSDELTIWRGITQEDIDRETPAFLSYTAALRDAGLLDPGVPDGWEEKGAGS